MEVFRILGRIAIDTEAADRALRDTSRQAGDTSSKVSAAVGKIGATAGKLAKGIGVAGLAVGTAWVTAIEGSREYRTEMGKLDTAFVTNGHSSETAKKTYSDHEQYQVLSGWIPALWLGR